MSSNIKICSIRHLGMLVVIPFLTVICSFSVRASPIAQDGQLEAVSIDNLIAVAINQHPTVQAEYSLGRASLEEFEAARLRRYPSLSLQAETSSAATSTGVARTFTVDQTIWSAGRDDALVDSAKATTEVHRAQLLETKYQVALRVVDAWQGLIQSSARIREIVLTQKKLDQFSAFMQRRIAAGVSPKIEMELVAMRVFRAQVDQQQAHAAAMTSKAKLEVMLGRKYAIEQLVGLLSLEDQVLHAAALTESEPSGQLLDAVEMHPTIKKAQFQAQAAQYDLKAQQAALWPQVYARYQKTIGGGSVPNADGFYVGLKYQPGAGFSSLAQAKAEQARAQGVQQRIDVVQRDLQDSIQADIEELIAARGRAKALAQAVTATALLLESYERQFVVGRRNWQEVMNAVRENNDERLSLVEARASILGTAYRLRIRMGGLVWQQDELRTVTQ